MVSKKILFSLFFISSVLISGYYFYQRSQSKKEESYPVNNKEEVQEEKPIKEEKKEEEPTIKNEEVPLVEINGWLDWLLLTIIIVIFLVSFLFYLGLTAPTHLNKYILGCFQNHFNLVNIGEEINNAIQTTKNNYEKPAESFVAEPKETMLKTNVKTVNYYRILQYCLENNKFYLSGEFCSDALPQEIKIYSPSKYLSFSVTIIFLSYNLYFFIKSFWQVGFQKTFENLNWLDLFSITKVFRRNSITKKIAFLVVVLFSWLILITAFLWYFSINTSEELDKYCSDNKLDGYLTDDAIPNGVKKTLDEILRMPNPQDPQPLK